MHAPVLERFRPFFETKRKPEVIPSNGWRSGAASFWAAFKLIGALCVCVGPASALTVSRDYGGSVADRIAQVNALTRQGAEVRIVGTCISACTLLLGVPGACVSPSARLGFHGPSTRIKGLPLPRQEYERVSLQMAAFYPKAIGNWFLSDARQVTGDYIVITGAQAIAMGARAC